MTKPLAALVAGELRAPAPPHAVAFARRLAATFEAPAAVLFYGSVLRTGDLDGVMDFYVLTARPRPGWRGLAGRHLWPDVSYHEIKIDGQVLRAKVAAMTLDQFAAAAAGRGVDTTIWTRFVQPSALVWVERLAVAETVIAAVAAAARTAARFAAALGPARGAPEAFWTALFQQTYAAEFRVERRGREQSILAFDGPRYDRLLLACWADEGLSAAVAADGSVGPDLAPAARRAVLAAWRRRRRLGKPLNLARLVKAAFTFEGAARYAAWKIERHTGLAVPLTPWRERHPILAAPGVLWSLWRARRGG
ncbi:MAG: hypothetical protein JWP92_1064 [Caulobacter sp.]|nr:hypothetical protein [Caulobacter sp.]